ncbi:hypothetical protein IJH72_02830 [Candidatus Saccharibacteria bacterium]|nr:hypothetical protein [Candidatus Saccharibacteria bacterium]
MSEPKNGKQKSLEITIFCISIAVVTVILCLLFSGKETRTSSNNIYSTKILYCVNNNPEDSFFTDSNAINNKHEIKVTYKDDKPDKVSYTYTGKFNTSTKADNSNATLHAKYNKYMAEYDLSPTILSPTFSVVESKLKINLFTDISNINNKTGKLFFLNLDEISSLTSESADKLKDIYSDKNFSCEINNSQKEEE